MIKLEFPKANLNAYESAEDKVKALKGQVDTLSTNLQIILDSIDESIDEDAIRKLVSPDIDSINNRMSELSDRVTDIEDADYGTRIDELESHDFIAEQGTSGIWAYIKWHSGVYECFAHTTATVSVSTASGNIYRTSSAYTINLPFTPVSIDYGEITPNTTSYMVWPAMISFNAQNSAMACYFLSSSSFTNSSINIRAYAKGKWK